MSTNVSESEDGELAHSPPVENVETEKKPVEEKMDYQSDDDDIIEVDALDIKPPQAKISDHRSRRRDHDRSRTRRSERSDRHSRGDSKRAEKHHREKSSRLGREREHQRDKYHRDQLGYSDQQYVNERIHRERKGEESRGRHQEARNDSKRHEKKDKERRGHFKDEDRNKRDGGKHDDRANKTLQDLRERLLEKRVKEGGKEDRSSSRHGKHRKSHKEKRRSKVEDILDGESGSLVKEIINITTEDRKLKKDKGIDKQLTEEERQEQDQRKAKFLEAERERERLKEQSKIERERRRQERVTKRKHEVIEAEAAKKLKTEEPSLSIFEVSDSEPEIEIEVSTPETDSEISQSENEEGSDRKQSRSDRSKSRSGSPDSETEKSRSRSRSPYFIKRSRSKTRSKTRSRSRSKKSRSRSIGESRSRTRSRSHLSSGRSRSRDRSLSKERHNHRRDSDDDEMLKHKDDKNEKGDEEIEIDADLPPYLPALQGCRSVEEFQCLNRIEEGTYGVVYRAKDKRTNEIVALKRLKMEKEKEGFPITSLREINTLLKGQHSNIVTVREIVVGSNMDKIFIVMDYVEHDLKSLMETMRHKKQSFMPGEVKCLLSQLLAAVAHLHDNWILHRDLKTSNLLLSHKGILKVGDFGLAREYGSPLKAYTPIVVTLWYRAPELLLGIKEYSTKIDVWSVGCIFAELLLMNPLFPGKSEVDQLNKIFKDLGTPSEKIWRGFNELPAVKKMKFTEYPVSNLRAKFSTLTEVGLGLLTKFLTFDPAQRVSAEEALNHPYFNEAPLPIDPAMFPTWPAKSELGHKRAMAASPKPPSGGGEYKKLGGEDEDYGFRLGMGVDLRRGGPGFSLKF